MPTDPIWVARGHEMQGQLKVKPIAKPKYTLAIKEHSETHLRKFYYMLVYSFKNLFND